MSVPAASEARPAAIRTLDAHVVNQIAAGEVVERPASIIRELLDNALDAGATRIEVELERGGIELVSVGDDGTGIAPESLELAISPHATSKIASAEDLSRIATLGFRGEALASIASVCRLTIRTRTREQAGASELRAEGGSRPVVRPAAGPIGTRVSAANLFFNTPARRRFLRTASTEQQHCTECVRRAALAHPAIGFSLRCDGRTLIEVEPGQSPVERAAAILGNDVRSAWLPAGADHLDDVRGVAIWGLVAPPSLAKATAKHQQVFLNGRFLRDRTVQHAIKEAYRGLIEPTRHPQALLMLEMDPASVDFNVHPAKLEVRFRDASMVHRAVHLAVRRALRSADLTPSDAGAHARGVRFERVTPAEDAGAAHEPEGVDARTFVARFLEAKPAAGTGRFDYASAERVRDADDRGPIAEDSSASSDERSTVSGPVDGTAAPSLASPRPAGSLLQVHNAYLVTQDEDGLVIIDQHALHERVMFEKLKARVSGEALQSQQLLVPVTADAPGDVIEAVGAQESVLSKAGFALRAMGPRTLVCEAFPVFLLERGVEPAGFLDDLIERFATMSGGESLDAEQLLHDVLDMMACKAAVKAGDKLSDTELAELLALRERVERSSSCPHGRPTAIRLTMHELERQFGRI